MKHLYVLLVFLPAFIAIDWSNLTHTLCFDVIVYPCANNTKEIIFYKEGSQYVFSLDAAGAQATYNHALFNKTGITTIFEHGFTSSPLFESAIEMIAAYSLLESTTNFFIVNATDDFGGEFINPADYMKASQATVCVGQIIAEYLIELRNLGVTEDLIHLIGHSLGAQAMHSCAQRYIELTSGVKIRQITGLDPAGPCFDPTTTLQLNSNDGTYVQIIHTNSGALGTTTRLGHADFIPNGGVVQAGCGVNASCSHNRASHYYRESVSSNQCLYTNVKTHELFLWDFILSKNSVTDVEQLGYRWGLTSGHYYAFTYSSSPFCEGTKGINN